MRINNIEDIEKSNLYYCYSLKQYKFLLKNDIDPLRVAFNNRTNKFMGIFVKTKVLSKLLKKWSNAGKRGERLIE